MILRINRDYFHRVNQLRYGLDFKMFFRLASALKGTTVHANLLEDNLLSKLEAANYRFIGRCEY
jgi:hypothetical protein